MACFRFNLQPLLQARVNREQQRQREVAAILRERLAIEERLRSHQAIIASGRDALRSALVGRVDAQSLRLHAASSIQQMRLAQRTAAELASVTQRTETARTLLIDARRDRRAIELLRERRMAEWKAAQERADIAAVDELAGHRRPTPEPT